MHSLQLQSVQLGRVSAEEKCQLERETGARRIEALQNSLTELQESLLEKKRELRLVNMHNLPLAGEASGLASLINEEGERLVTVT